ncbi:hypothetical protein FF100_26600 [Methylobacterium terricola]|uniref:F5/8 type C domain-containing protein n=1 Tax=Methylobacterium terricola TaxID=2583531 RepID=A0A5C4L9U6_9HYPH|nr:glycosyltransferase family 2 protein [Methylobacterium terricola]TNC09408.1 hypothetical protein FF100_26600 [Methylobacterium terricola]
MAKYQHAILNTARWESATIVEWLQYYISLGFDHAYIYCNDDDPAEMYEQLLPYIECDRPFVTFHHMPYQGQQAACWVHFLESHKNECDWFLFIDADEFLTLKPHNSIKEFMRGREGNVDCIHFNWIWFGPEDFEERPAGSTLLQFTHRESEMVQMNYFTKTLNRSSAIDARHIGRPPVDMLNHRWPPTVAAGLREVNVLGESMTEFFAEFPHSAERFMADIGRRKRIIETAVLYHYLFRSKKDFQRRADRGTLGAYYFQPMWAGLPSRTEEFAGFLGRLAEKEDLYLHDYWSSYKSEIARRARSTSLVTPNPLPNLARGSSPEQSSISPWSVGKDPVSDARGAISGIHTGADGFHTEIEENPWWKTDLGGLAQISEIRVFNSLKNPSMAARAYPLVIDTSVDGENWERLFHNSGESPFGGVDGHPLIVRTDRKATFVKLWLTTRDYFHLDEVEIYGAIL